ncbi:interleukin-2 precursor [Dasypus novemcinctus]|uniref:Interleukin-2 n=1 Tax=Dasypus novemcinctus TaxID=9361 RepID=IL2_DASNO|nr:interleukin-2 precursor [Dasypus novemcinctus]Q1WM29.1 RecName: Full=Interleukin-2; Short=IL-2; AltName: Full=T-cell growth factor; Short=TCGF; Flags: Precursor [Dasypus novemcinctus]AAY82084.1 interleukin-2 [Dasypus novemcinctus]
MYKMQLVACIALSLVLITNSAPTSSSTKETQQQLEQLLLDLKMLSKMVNNKDLKLPRMLTFKFYMPKRVTELKHLQCLVEELKPLENVLNLAQSQMSQLEHNGDLISNINITVLELKGSETTFMCDYDDEAATIVEFLNKWIIFCQSIISKRLDN